MKASNVIAAFVLAAAIAATVVLVYVNMPKLPTEAMIVNAVNSTTSYSYTTNITSQLINQTSEGGFANGVYYLMWTTKGEPPVEWVLYNGSLYVNDSGGGFMKINLSKKDLKSVLSSMSLADRVSSILKNATITYRGRHGNGFILKAEYNKTVSAQSNLLTGSKVHIVQNITIILDPNYRPTRINMTILFKQNDSVSKMVAVTSIKYSNTSLPSWVLNALKS